jgi:hypothetical protein
MKSTRASLPRAFSTPEMAITVVLRGLERAVLAKALKLPFDPEIGLWKAYGDVTCQDVQ